MKKIEEINLYHITSFNNLSSILKEGLFCYNYSSNYENIGDQTLKKSRGTKIIARNPLMTLNDCVPFYFGPRSVMLYVISKGSVESVNCKQKDIVYLVVKLTDILKEDLPFMFTDGHAYDTFTHYYKDINDLSKLDWEILFSKEWNNTLTDNDRKRRKQAEFLLFNNLPPKLIFGIGVLNEEMQKSVEDLLTSLQLKVPCKIKKEWYY